MTCGCVDLRLLLDVKCYGYIQTLCGGIASPPFIVLFLSQAELVEARLKNTSIPTDRQPALSADGDGADGAHTADC